MVIAAGTPAEAARNSDGRETAQGWGSSGWGSSGYGSTSNKPRTPKGSSNAVHSSDGASKGGTPVPEPSNLLMLVLGLVGLIAGRMAARRRKKL